MVYGTCFKFFNIYIFKCSSAMDCCFWQVDIFVVTLAFILLDREMNWIVPYYFSIFLFNGESIEQRVRMSF